MAKRGLFSKVFGKQESSCCSMSFEEVSEDEAANEQPNEQHDGGQKPNSAEKEAAKTEAIRDTASNR